MLDAAAIDRIAEELEKVSASTEYGPLGVEVAAALASGVPIVGPLLGVLVKKVGDGRVGPDLKDMLTRTVWEIQQIVPEINKLQTLHDRVQFLEDRKSNQKLQYLLERAAKEINQSGYDLVKFETVNSSLSARNITVTGRPMSSSASGGSSVDLTGMRQSGGAATFTTTDGSRQVLDNSSFTNGNGAVRTSGNVQHSRGVLKFDGGTVTHTVASNDGMGARLIFYSSRGGGAKIEFG